MCRNFLWLPCLHRCLILGLGLWLPCLHYCLVLGLWLWLPCLHHGLILGWLLYYICTIFSYITITFLLIFSYKARYFLTILTGHLCLPVAAMITHAPSLYWSVLLCWMKHFWWNGNTHKSSTLWSINSACLKMPHMIRAS